MTNEPPQFHDVVFIVERVERGAVVHDEQQTITARETIKLMPKDVVKLESILAEYIDSYRDGAGPLLLTFTGKFSH